MISYVVGDLLSADVDVIGHGCNIRGAFGAGVAGQIAERFPVARQRYLEKHRDSGWHLGDVQVVLVRKKPALYVANLATQDGYGGRGPHVDYPAIEKALTTLFTYCEAQTQLRLAIPQIGCGLASGTWERVGRILRRCYGGMTFPLTVYSWLPW